MLVDREGQGGHVKTGTPWACWVGRSGRPAAAGVQADDSIRLGQPSLCGMLVLALPVADQPAQRAKINVFLDLNIVLRVVTTDHIFLNMYPQALFAQEIRQ